VDFKKVWLKFGNKKKYSEYKHEQLKQKRKFLYDNKIKNFLDKIDNCLNSKNEISFLHSGHLGDVVNALPLIKEISKLKKCNYFIEAEKPIPKHLLGSSNPYGDFYLTNKSVDMILPLLKNQKYLSSVEKYRNQSIDINLNLFRELPINFNLDSVRWYFHLTGIHANLNDRYIVVDGHKSIKDKVVIIRSSRRKNIFINYKFLNKYENIVFLGLKDEFIDLKKDIPNMEFYDCRDFLEMAEIIKNARIFIGNLSFGYTIAEGLKIPRILESNPDFPLVYPNGGNGFDFYFQNHFQILFEKLYSQKI